MTGEIEAREILCERTAKALFATAAPDLLQQYLRDDATAFNANKRGTIDKKGVLNNAISDVFLRLLADAGAPTHGVRRLDDRHKLVEKLAIIPIEVVVRNVVAGSLAGRLGMEEGRVRQNPLSSICTRVMRSTIPSSMNAHLDL